ncbi:MAG: GNAT family N-acetyltransferase, partial [Candidatus Hodarchaeota archaeon]
MLSKVEIIKYQKNFFNIWPPKHCYFLNGWILAFTGGKTGRSNSVLAVDYYGVNVDSDIEFVESVYEQQNLPVRFKLSECLNPPELEEKLLERNYIYSDYTIIAMGSENQKFPNQSNDKFHFKSSEVQTPEFMKFLDKFSTETTEDQQIMFEITQRIVIPKKCFISAKAGKIIVSSIMAILDPQGAMYIAELFVHPSYRRQKLGLSLLTKAMKWGRDLGATKYWLHVEKNNSSAITLYESLGFQIWY